MSKYGVQIGQRVELIRYPFCPGEVVEIICELKIGYITVGERYRVKWDNPEYGESDWITTYDLFCLQTKDN